MSQPKIFPIPTLTSIFFFLFLGIVSFSAGLSWNNYQNKNIKTSTDSNKPTVAKTVFSPQVSTLPELKFFVMSFCPYGNQIESVIRPVFDLFGKNVTLKPQYIFSKIDNLETYCQQNSGDPTKCSSYITDPSAPFKTIPDCQKYFADIKSKCLDEKQYLKTQTGALYASLHGRQEANQNVREICAWNQSPDKKQWWDFIDNVNKNCTSQNADTCWEDQAKTAGLDTNKITECFNQEAVTLIEKEIAESESANAYSSPTVIINGVNFPPETAWGQDGTGSISIGKKIFTQAKYRSPDTIKEAICASFKNPPKVCKTVLADIASATTNGAGCQ